MPTLLRFELEDADAVAREYASNLRHGRMLVPQLVDAEPLSEACVELVRASDGACLRLDVRILMLLPDGPARGTAVEIVPSSGLMERLERFANGGAGDGETVAAPSVAPAALDPAPLALDEAAALPLLEDLPSLDDPANGEPPPPISVFPSAGTNVDEAGDRDEGSTDPKIVRIRKLGATERSRLARTGHLEDRVLLERVFAKDVWEDLLRNPQLTVPEVARIAAKGTVPRILLESIVENPSWSKQSIVRRALLLNPRLSVDSATKLLRATPKNELKLIVQGTAYPAAVRGLAKKLLTE